MGTITQKVKNNLKTLVRKKKNQRAYKYAEFYEKTQIRPKTVLFEARDGKSFTDSPRAMYLAMLADERFKDYQFYWVYTAASEAAIKYVPLDERVQFIARDSDEYLYCLTSCQYLINNSTFPFFYTKKPGQVYINTWHGTPLKKMGFDMPNELTGSKNVLRNLLMTDYFISPNSYTTDIFRRAYKLDGLYDGQILESGYPRIDLTAQKSKALQAEMAANGIGLDLNKKIVLYTPTWKGTKFNKPDILLRQLGSEVEKLQTELGTDYQILCKVHPFAYNYIKETGYIDEYLVPDTIDANELLAVVDVLITDYSSIFFDFLVTDKPIIFYCYDRESYENDRGLYMDETALPGPVELRMDDVIADILNLATVMPKYQSNYQKMKQQMCTCQDGQVTEKLLDQIFFGVEHFEPVIILKKTRLLIYGGSLKGNGITESLLSLLHNLDQDKYDITLLANERINHHGSENESVKKRLQQLVHEYRILFKFGLPIYTSEEVEIDNMLMRNKYQDDFTTIYPKTAYEREARRLFACCKFDIAIDFSGYSYYWAKLLLASDAKKHFIFEHNDLYEEQYKVINNKKVHYNNLQGVFRLYRYFDKIISVSDALCQVNSQKLAQFVPREKFVSVPNTLRLDRILGRKDSKQAKPKFSNVCSIKQSFQAKEAKIKVWPNWQAEPVEIEVLGQNLIGFIAIYRNGKYYYKVMLDGNIIGWVEATAVIPSNDYIIEERDVHFKAAVRPLKGFNYYNLPYNTVDNTEVFGSLSRLWQVEMTIKREVLTDFDIYLEMYYQNEFIGWATQSALQKTSGDLLHPIKALYKRLAARVKVAKRPRQQKILHAKAKVLKNSKLYTHALGTYRTRAKDYTTADLGENIIITRQIKSKEVTSYKLFGNGIEGWVDANDIQIEQLDSIVLAEKVIKKQAHFTDSWPIVYPTLEQVANKDNHNEVFSYRICASSVPVDIEVTKVYETVYGEFAEIYAANELIGYTEMQNLQFMELAEEERQLDSTKINLINVARMSPEKNQLALIEALALLFEQYPQYQEQVCLYLVGDGVLAEQIRAAIKKYHLEDNVILTGRLDNPYVLMQQATALVFPSLYEGQGLVLLEAMILGLDIIASDIPTSVEVLDHGKYGLLAAGTDSQALATALADYLNNSHKFAKFDYLQYNKDAIAKLEQLFEEN